VISYDYNSYCFIATIKKEVFEMHTEIDKAVWLIHVVQYTADELNLSVTETARLLDEYGFVKIVWDGYESFHTQGFEYMAELITSELKNAQAVR